MSKILKTFLGFLFVLSILLSCTNQKTDLTNKNQELQNKIDSLTNELNKCDMMLESYEGLPMGI